MLTIALSSFAVAQGETYTFILNDRKFTHEFVGVGNPGNPSHQVTPKFAMGQVDYAYLIGVYELSCLEWGVTGRHCSEEYAPPVGTARWWTVAEFVNQLNRSFGFPDVYMLAGESAVPWPENSPEHDSQNPLRNRLSNFALPTKDEWHKAAYYDPEQEMYWKYATGSDSPPQSVTEGTAPGTAVFGPRWASVKRAGGLSPYGTMGQTGNAPEWEESYANPRFPLFGHSIRVGNTTPALAASNLSREVVDSRTPGFRIVSLGRPSPFDCNSDNRVTLTDLECSNDLGSTNDLLLQLDLVSGDLDGNGHVEFADFLRLAENFGSTKSAYTDGDIDGADGVGMSDFLILSANYNTSSPELAVSNVPEPSSDVRAVVAAFAVALLRRRAG